METDTLKKRRLKLSVNVTIMTQQLKTVQTGKRQISSPSFGTKFKISERPLDKSLFSFSKLQVTSQIRGPESRKPIFQGLKPFSGFHLWEYICVIRLVYKSVAFIRLCFVNFFQSWKSFYIYQFSKFSTIMTSHYLPPGLVGGDKYRPQRRPFGNRSNHRRG